MSSRGIRGNNGIHGLSENRRLSGIHEECGILGIYSPFSADLAGTCYMGLYALQHRGQESCGIVVNNDGVFSSHKGCGLVGEIFTSDVLRSFPRGSIACGHVRYATTGGNDIRNCQPLLVNHHKGSLAVCHNGNLTNADVLRNDLEEAGAIFHTTSDTETIAYIITRERLTSGSIEEAVSKTMNVIKGAYSLVIMSPQKLIAARDPNGLRPLCIGRTDDGIYVAASESTALTAAGAKFMRDVKPGEIVIFRGDGISSLDTHCAGKAPSVCIFEHIYFAAPESVIDGKSVAEFRMNAGKALAGRYPTDADTVIGVPDSGLPAALGYSRASGIPLCFGLVKNKYVGRTFIAPGNDLRQDAVRLKLSAVPSLVAGRRVVLIDDSIVRGNTMGRIVKLLREAGALSVHVMISSPPFLHPCYYGTDVDSEDDLIAAHHNIEDIRQLIGADSLGYLCIEDLRKIYGGDCFCDACFSGNYPTEIPRNTFKNKFETYISRRREID